jgi:transcriptional regulator with XRE-family HTH domain
MELNIDYTKLRDFRKREGLTQKEVADILGVEQSAYSRIERGERNIGIDQLSKLAAAFKKRICDFLKDPKCEASSNLNEQVCKKDITFFGSLLCNLSVSLEKEIDEIYEDYQKRYPFNLISFNHYIKNDTWYNPNYFLQKIRTDIDTFKTTHKCPENYQTYSIELFIGKDETWLRDFSLDKTNFKFILNLFGNPRIYRPIDRYKAFEDMLDNERFVFIFFAFGLMEDSAYSHLWEKYCKKWKLYIDPYSLYKGRKMQNVFKEAGKSVYYYGY